MRRLELRRPTDPELGGLATAETDATAGDPERVSLPPSSLRIRISSKVMTLMASPWAD
jgi:hypothetical protein